jgi:spermidine/putrescine transport system ATP-binding protein
VIRPERISIHAPGSPLDPGVNAISGTVKHVVYLGNCTQVHVDVGAETEMVVEVPNLSGPQSVPHGAGEKVTCVCTHDAVRVLGVSAVSTPSPAPS